MTYIRMSAVALAVLAAFPAMAASLTAEAPLPGYKCDLLDISDAQANDRDLFIPILVNPSSDSPVLGAATGIVLVRDPAHEESNFVEMVMPNRKIGWISSSVLKTFRSRGNPAARCMPVYLSNGSLGWSIH